MGTFGKSDTIGEGMCAIDFILEKAKANFALWNANTDPLLQVRC
jgi:hypothetical protein